MTAALDLGSASLAARLQSMNIKVDGTPFSLRRYPYLIDLFDESARYTTVLKGAQMGFTSWIVLKYLAGAASHDLRGVGIYFPSHNDASDFAKARVDPMLEQSAFQGLVNDTNTHGLKMIAGTQFYMRGAGPLGGSTTGSMSPVKSIPLDWLAFDERDEMMPSRVEDAEFRLSGSQCPEQSQLSTPTLKNYGVDLEFQESNQCHWYWVCPKCNGEVCLEKEYPDCIALPGGEPAFYICSKCREPLQRVQGLWIPDEPHITDHRGFRVSQLSSNTRSAEDIVRDARRSDQRGKPRAFHNQVLAEAYADAHDQLNKVLIDACLTRDPKRMQSEGPSMMGVDPGRACKNNYYWIAERISETDTDVTNYGVAEDFNQIYALAKRFNVRVGIMDRGAETHAVDEFVKENQAWWGGQYNTARQAAEAIWDEKHRIVKIARTPCLDATVQEIVRCRVHLPAPNPDYHKLVIPQLTNMGRNELKDPETGAIRGQWVITSKVKNDHLHHAFGLATIAKERAPLSNRTRRSRYGPARGHRPTQEWLAS